MFFVGPNGYAEVYIGNLASIVVQVSFCDTCLADHWRHI